MARGPSLPAPGRRWPVLCLLVIGCDASSVDSEVSTTGGSTTDGSTTVQGSTATTSNPISGDETRGGETRTTGTTPADGWMQLGWGLYEFHPLRDGDELPIRLGSQGLWMWPVPLQAGGIPLPPDPSDWQHPDIPMLQMWLDIEGVPPVVDGHFTHIEEYPVTFEIRPDDPDVYEFVAVWMIVPDGWQPEELIGRPGTLHGELVCADGQHISVEYDVVISLSE